MHFGRTLTHTDNTFGMRDGAGMQWQCGVQREKET